MQAFEIELILGTPAGIDVYSTVIYRAMRQEPPLHGVASALSLLFIMIVIPLVLVQQYLVKKQGHAVIRGRISTRTQDLGKWRWPLFAAIVLLLLTMTALPMVMLLVGSFMKIFGAFDLPGVWTTRHWHEAFSRPELVRALSNTLQLGAGAALIGMGLYTVIAYIIVKTQLVGRRAFDILTWLPTVVPGIVLSLGLLQMVLQTSALRAIYGTTWILILAVLIGNLTVGVQVIRTTLLQLTAELEEASWTSGGGRLRTFFRIALPITAPSIIIVGLEVFATAVSIVSVVVLLGTGPTQPLSILQLAYLDSGQFESATIVGLLIMVISITAAILARVVSARFGLSRD
jgi:iron(III) transport system permease protein